MPYDDEQRQSESRKLEALTAISTAIEVLGKSLVTILEHHRDQSRRLDAVDQKLDKLLAMAEGPERAKSKG